MEDVKSAIKYRHQDPSRAVSDTIPTLASTSKPPSHKKDDFPAIKFWQRWDYTQYLNSKKKSRGIIDPNIAPTQHGGTRLAASNENVATDYIELEDGQVVEGDKAANIRKRVRNIFKEMRSSAKMDLPKTWSEAGITERNFFLQELYKDYPYIAFCDDDWKGIFLASRTLSAFHNSLRRKDWKVKSEVVEKKEELLWSLAITMTANSDPIPHSPVKRTADEISHADELPLKQCRILTPIPTPAESPSTSILPPFKSTDIQPSSGPVTVPSPQLPKTQWTQGENGKQEERLLQAATETTGKAPPTLPLVELVNPL